MRCGKTCTDSTVCAQRQRRQREAGAAPAASASAGDSKSESIDTRSLQPVYILLSDGEDGTGATLDCVYQLKQADPTLRVFVFSMLVKEAGAVAHLRRIAQITGGEFCDVRNAVQLQDGFLRLSSAIEPQTSLMARSDQA